MIGLKGIIQINTFGPLLQDASDRDMFCHFTEQNQPVALEKDCCMEPSQELLLWAVLMGRGELAELFWEQRPVSPLSFD